MILQKQVDVIHKKVGPANKRSQRAWGMEHRVKFKAESSKLKAQS